VLALSNVQVSYEGSMALRGIDLTVPQGSLVAVIGPNGAGKSTLLRTISGLVARSAGKVTFDGGDLAPLSPDRIVRRGVVHVPEGRMVIGRMSVRDNLLLGAYSRPRNEDAGSELEKVLALFPRLKERLKQLAGSLSGGEQQMLAIGRGLMARPRLLMLDEPSLGLAPMVIARIFEVLNEIRSRGIAVMLVEQNAEMALATADFAYVLDLGRVAAQGPARDLLADERVRSAYLGV
jgi:branched-chain amino acid transport system ATP-binding protein